MHELEPVSVEVGDVGSVVIDWVFGRRNFFVS
jgi:hypothetical protein